MPEPIIERPIAELPFDERVRKLFGARVVDKGFGAAEAFGRLPRYVSEYLIAKYVKKETAADDLEKIKAQLKERLPDASRKEWVKDRLVREREFVLIDQIDVRVDLKSGERWASVPALDDRYVHVPATIVEQFPGIVAGGMWGTAKLRWKPEEDEEHPVSLATFTPFQVDVTTVDDVVAARRHFTTDEWIRLTLASVGLDANALSTERQRMLVLARLVPLVERNVNVIELGPRQTGKTFLLRNTSPQVFLVSGGKATAATLFGNLSTHTPGILATRKCVVFDEVSATDFDDAKTTVSMLKDYLESGQFSRGPRTHASEASVFLAGNIDVEDGRPATRVHAFEPLPRALLDTAFLDRIHGYLPGWEVPKITRSALATGPGFVVDYFGEYLLRLRDREMRGEARRLSFNKHLTQRDLVAVERITSGLLKLIYPDGSATESELHRLASLAVELRQRVFNQLVKLAPGEFKTKAIAFEGMIASGAVDMQEPRASEAIERWDRMNHEAVVGEITGLATIEQAGALSGDLIVVEASHVSGAAGVEVTGGRGKILRESVRAAYQLVRSRAAELGVAKLLDAQKVVVHIVHIAEEREGPSAGAAFVAAIVSAATRRPVKPAVAVTGEVSLHGKVVEVGGIPQKLEAAARAGRRLVVIPRANAAELERVDDAVISKLEIVPVETVDELLAAVLEETPREVARDDDQRGTE